MTARLKSARMTNSTAGTTIDDHLADLEAALAELLGINLDQDYTGSVNLGGQGGEMDFALIASSAQLANFTGETVFNKSRTLTAAALNTVGCVCRMRISGSFSNMAALNGSDFYVVVKVGSTYIFRPSESWPTVIGDSNGRWSIDLELTTRSTGATGVVATSGVWVQAADQVGGQSAGNFYLTATLDLTGALEFKAYAYFDAADALRTCKINSWTIEILQASHTA
jgi:hypothetical protein